MSYDPKQRHRPSATSKAFAFFGYILLIFLTFCVHFTLMKAQSTYYLHTEAPDLALSSNCQQGFEAVIAILLMPLPLAGCVINGLRWRRPRNLLLALYCAALTLGLVASVTLVVSVDIEEPETCQ